jgi:hypothetical protein
VVVAVGFWEWRQGKERDDNRKRDAPEKATFVRETDRQKVLPFRSMSFCTHQSFACADRLDACLAMNDGGTASQSGKRWLRIRLPSCIRIEVGRCAVAREHRVPAKSAQTVETGPIAASAAGTSFVDTRNPSGDVGSPLRSLDQYRYGRHVLYSTTFPTGHGWAFQSPSSFRQYHIGDPCRRLSKQGKGSDPVGTRSAGRCPFGSMSRIL